MTRAVQSQSTVPDSVSVHSTEQSDHEKSYGASLHPIGDSASDGDTGERPVREKLKKTSIASIPKYGFTSVETAAEEQADMSMKSRSEEGDQAPGQQPMETGMERRGRAIRKRSLEDFDAADISEGISAEKNIDGHIRKRSRDIRSGSSINSRSRRRSPEVPVREESEDLDCGPQATALRHNLEETSIQEDKPNPILEATDHDMQETVLSPKKKRSRDQFELESQREQKIAATDENRARRRSSEEARRTNETDSSKYKAGEQSLPNGHVYSPKDDSGRIQNEDSVTKESQASGFSNTSITSPFAAFGNSTSIFGGTPALSSKSVNHRTQTAASAFASSGFAALAGPSASPAQTSQTTTATSTLSSNACVKTSPPQAPKASFATSEIGEATSFGSFQKAGSSRFGSGKTTIFTPAGASGFGSLRGSTFGSGFSSGFGGGQKLTSFAAPIGDIKSSALKAKALGVVNPSDNEDSGSEDGESTGGDAEHEKDDETSRFQIQDVDTGEEGEDTIFQARAKLFEFRHDNQIWAERGIGTFKLNVTPQDLEKKEEEGESRARARFVMRATATHKVMLNAPIFKEMSITEMAGNKIMFSVPLEDKLIPYTLRMGKEEDIKNVYREVQRLQGEM